MVILAYDVQGVIFCHFVSHGETVNAQYYAAYLQNHLHRAVRHKRPQLQNVIILHDNATPHKAICVRDLLTMLEVGSTGASTILTGPFALIMI